VSHIVVGSICESTDSCICLPVVPKSVTRERIIGELVVTVWSVRPQMDSPDRGLSEPQSRRLDRRRDGRAKGDRQDSSLPRMSSYLDGLGKPRLHGLIEGPLHYNSASLFIGYVVQSLRQGRILSCFWK
jgi:hypothetical protein